MDDGENHLVHPFLLIFPKVFTLDAMQLQQVPWSEFTQPLILNTMPMHCKKSSKPQSQTFLFVKV